MRTRTRTQSEQRADIVHAWLWWSTFVLSRQRAHGVVGAYKAAQAATARLYA